MFDLSHWLFAAYYWKCSKRLEHIALTGAPSQSWETLGRFVFWSLAFVNTAIPIGFGVVIYLMPHKLKWSLISVGCSLILQTVSCLFLTVAIFTIKRVVKQVSGLQIEIKNLVLHLSSFYLYLITYVVYFLQDIIWDKDQYGDEQTVYIYSQIRLAFCFIS